MAETRRYRIRGIVQGVGMRPFVYRAARRRSLGGWVRNDSAGVLLELSGEPADLEALVAQVGDDAPPAARIDSVELLERRSGGGEGGFEIRLSEGSAPASALVAPDSAVCEECLRELLDPGDRRHLYPYISCANCGPRYTIVRGVPYDRALTTMAAYAMCAACRAEYDDPGDRRFHAQPIACWDCGPRFVLRGADGTGEAGEDPISATTRLLGAGAIVAVKGLGGYHLIADARNEAAVAELRRRKRREAKPFALMSTSLAAVRAYAEVGEEEAELLRSPARPIVLLGKRAGADLAAAVAPGVRTFGAMLAYAPLHHLLLRGALDTVVATSGNLAEEPLAYEDEDALERLAPIADAFLVGERQIHTPVDDSIARATRLGGEVTPTRLRRARGYVPEPLPPPFEPPPLLAVGAQLKSTVCLSRGPDLFLGQHLGDLDNAAARASFERAIEDLQTLLEVKPELVAHDLHPDYASTAWARERSGLPTVAVQHHHAHLAACMCEHGLTEPVLGVIFDGAGYGGDGHIWGGEFLLGDYAGFERAAQLEYCPLPGGDRATAEPWRVALALLQRAFGSFEECDLPVVRRRSDEERRVLGRMIEAGVNAPLSSSVGRLFDGVAALLGLREAAAYEAQAAIELEALIDPGAPSAEPFQWALHDEDSPLRIDPRPLVRELVAELRGAEASTAELSARFHATVVEIVHRTCERVRAQTGIAKVALSGGVFQNALLLRGCDAALREAGFAVHTHRRVPPNDGGIALGQAAIAAWQRNYPNN